jgi:hypothetical protein
MLPLTVYNATGAPLAVGRLVYVNGYNTTFNLPTVAYAVADGTGKLAQYIVQKAIPTATIGNVVAACLIGGLNTSSYAAVGDPCYLSPTSAGLCQAAQPGAQADTQKVGEIVRVHGSLGEISFDPQNVEVGQAAPGYAYVEITGNTANGDTITIGPYTYEFNAVELNVTPPNIWIDMSAGGVGHANSATKAATSINAHAAGVCNAISSDDGTNGLVALVAKKPGADTNYGLSKVAANITVSEAALVGSAGPAIRHVLKGLRTIDAADVTLLAVVLGTSKIPVGGFPCTSAPRVENAFAITAAGVVKTLVGASGGLLTLVQAGTGYYVLYYAEPAGGARLANTDVLRYEVSYAL